MPCNVYLVRPRFSLFFDEFCFVDPYAPCRSRSMERAHCRLYTAFQNLARSGENRRSPKLTNVGHVSSIHIHICIYIMLPLDFVTDKRVRLTGWLIAGWPATSQNYCLCLDRTVFFSHNNQPKQYFSVLPKQYFPLVPLKATSSLPLRASCITGGLNQIIYSAPARFHRTQKKGFHIS